MEFLGEAFHAYSARPVCSTHHYA